MASVSAPVAENDEVAVPPKYAVPVFEKSVEDAAPFNNRSEVVALCPAAGCVNGSYDERKSEPAVAAVTCPPVVVLSNEPLAIPEIQRFVELAVVAETIVVDANGIESPVPAGAAKLIVSAEPPTSAPGVPVKESAVPALTEDVATD